MQSSDSKIVDSYFQQLSQKPPFSFLEEDELRYWLNNSKLLKAKPGETIISNKSLQDRIYLLVNGQIRLLKINDNGSIHTLAKRGSGQLLGWVSLLRAAPTEWITASEDSVLLALPAQNFLTSFKHNTRFKSWFGSLTQPQESTLVALAALDQKAQKPENWSSLIESQVKKSVVISFDKDCIFTPPDNGEFCSYTWHLSTSGLPDYSIGTLLEPGSKLDAPDSFNLPLRVIGFPTLDESVNLSSQTEHTYNKSSDLGILPAVSLQQLGILEEDHLVEGDKYPYVSGKGEISEVLAVCEMTALHLKVPFRYDGIKKAVESHFRRDKVLSLELLAALTEGLGLRTQLGFVQNDYLASIEAPALLMLEGSPVILFQVQPDEITLGHPRKGL